MKFTLDGAAGGAQAAGNSIGNAFKAFAMGPMVREQAQRQAEDVLARIYANNMTGNMRGAEALKTQEEATGLRMTNQARTAPIDASLPQYLQHAFRLFQATGDTNMDRFADAGQTLQSMGMTDKAAANIDNLDLANRWNTLAKPGNTYMPFDNVGTSGYSLNKATGAAIEANPVLARLFGDKNASEVAENRAQANSANAAAGKYGAETEQTRMENAHLKEKGVLPGRASSGGGGGGLTLPQAIDDARSEYALRYPTDFSGRRPKEAPSFDEFKAAYLSNYGFGGEAPANKSAAPSSQPSKMPSKRGSYASADEVKAAFRDGKISRDEAKAILQKDFGMK